MSVKELTSFSNKPNRTSIRCWNLQVDGATNLGSISVPDVGPVQEDQINVVRNQTFNQPLYRIVDDVANPVGATIQLKVTRYNDVIHYETSEIGVVNSLETNATIAFELPGVNETFWAKSFSRSPYVNQIEDTDAVGFCHIREVDDTAGNPIKVISLGTIAAGDSLLIYNQVLTFPAEPFVV